MNFAFIEYWPLLLLIPAAIILLAYIRERSEGVVFSMLRPDQYKFHFPALKITLRGAAFGLMIIALLGPYWGRKQQQVNILGREVYFLLDVSASMNARDLKPPRLEKAKRELKKMVAALRGDRMGIIVFTTHSFVQCPLTTDFNALNMFIDLVQTDQFSNTGTNFRSALLMAYHRFLKTEATSRKTTRSIVLISDGEDFGENYTSVIERFKKHDIAVYSVGVGTYEGAAIPDKILGKTEGYKKRPDGTLARSALQDNLLMQLSEEFGTEYIRLDEQIDDLRPVTEQLKLRSASVIDTKIEEVRTNRYQWFLAGSLLLFGISLVLMPMRKKRKIE